MKLIVSLLMVCLCSGCVTNHGTYTVLTNKLINVERFETKKQPRVPNLNGDARGHSILSIEIKGSPALPEALNTVFMKSDTDMMVDVRVKSWFWLIPYIYGNYGWHVQGNGIKTKTD